MPKKRKERRAKDKEKLEGINGWLMLPIINLIYAIPICILDIILILMKYDYTPLLILMVGTDVVISGLSIYTLFLTFHKDRKAPIFLIIFPWLDALIHIPSLLGDRDLLVIAEIIYAAIWTVYFLVSKRVKNTFVKYISERGKN